MHLVEAHLQQPRQHHLGVVQVVELAVEGGGGEGDGVPVPFHLRQVVGDRPLCVMGTDPDALPAVDAPLLQDAGLAVPDPDGLGGAPLDAGDASPAGVRIQGDRMDIFFHSNTPNRRQRA